MVAVGNDLQLEYFWQATEEFGTLRDSRAVNYALPAGALLPYATLSNCFVEMAFVTM